MQPFSNAPSAISAFTAFFTLTATARCTLSVSQPVNTGITFDGFTEIAGVESGAG